MKKFLAATIIATQGMATLSAATHNLLFFDSALAMQQSLEGQKIAQDLNAEVGRLQEIAQGWEKELKAEEELLGKQASLMTPDKHTERKIAHAQKVKDIQRKREDFGEQLNTKVQFEQEKLFNKQIKIAIPVCKEKNGLSLIDKRLPGVHFVSDELDITSAVVAAVDAAYKKELESEKKIEAEKKSSKKGA